MQCRGNVNFAFPFVPFNFNLTNLGFVNFRSMGDGFLYNFYGKCRGFEGDTS